MWSFMSLGSCLARSLGLCACFPGVNHGVDVLFGFYSSQIPGSESSLVCR